MSIYNKKNVFDFNFLFGKNGKPELARLIIAIAVLLVLGFFAWNYLFASPLTLSFDKSTIKANEQAILKIGVSNPFTVTASDVLVEVIPFDKKSILVHEPKRVIEVLDNYRELTFLVNPVGSVLPGNYGIKITVTVNNQKFEETTMLTIK